MLTALGIVLHLLNILVFKYMAMKKLNLFAVVMTMMVVSAYGANVE